MESVEILGLLIGLVATAGGLAVGAIIVKVAVTTDSKAKLAALEARSRERLALIEKGMDPSLLNDPSMNRTPKNRTDIALFWGLLLSGIGLGALIGYFVSFVSDLNGAITINSMAILMGGFGLLMYNRRKVKQADRLDKNA